MKNNNISVLDTSICTQNKGDEIIMDAVYDELYEIFRDEILFSGVIPPNPTHLLANGNFERLIKEAKLIYDYIIVDLAPTILVTDTLLVAPLADATICVVRANHTEKQIIPFSVNLSKAKRLKNMVYVLNGIDQNKGYGYNYGCNYGYDHDQDD